MIPDQKFSKIGRLLQDGINNEVYTAAQVAWCTGHLPPVTLCVGNTKTGPVTNRTRFDIASVTKPFAAAACLRLTSRIHLPLDTPLCELVPLSAGFSQATLLQLLAHEAGFVAWLPLFEAVPLNERGKSAAGTSIIRSAIQSPSEYPPGTKAVYSDLGYMILLEILEKISGCSIREIIRDEVTVPLDLTQTDFRPLGDSPLDAKPDIAPTESCSWRKKRLIGEVHDDNAWSMGGLAAHAGLFSTASELARFGDAWLKTMRNGHWLPTDIAQTAVQRRPSGRGLGWDLKSGATSTAGSQMSTDTFGHLGFTGCSLWVDPMNNISIALLTNRVYFGRENHELRSFRPLFHDTLMQALSA